MINIIILSKVFSHWMKKKLTKRLTAVPTSSARRVGINGLTAEICDFLIVAYLLNCLYASSGYEAITSKLPRLLGTSRKTAQLYGVYLLIEASICIGSLCRRMTPTENVPAFLAGTHYCGDCSLSPVPCLLFL